MGRCSKEPRPGRSIFISHVVVLKKKAAGELCSLYIPVSMQPLPLHRLACRTAQSPSFILISSHRRTKAG